MQKVQRSDAEWREQLSSKQYRILRKAGTELPFAGAYVNTKDDGTYCCAGCGNELFSSETKFDSRTGWPSFFDPATGDAVITRADNGLLTRRTEVLCAGCESHLGHVFADGPAPTGQRYCINSCALELDSEGQPSS